MRRTNNTILIVIAILLYSCTTYDYDIRYKEFNNIVKVENYKEIKIPKYLKSADFLLMDSFLLVRDIYSHEYFFHLLGRDSLNYITTTGRIGKGPGEITQSGPVVFDEDNYSFYAVDYPKALLHRFVLNPDSLTPSYLPRPYKRFKKGMAFINIELIDDSMAIVNNIDLSNPDDPASIGNTALSYLNMNTGEFNKLQCYSPPEKICTDDYYTSMFGFAVSPNKEFCAIGYFVSDVIDIINLKTHEQKRIVGPLGIYDPHMSQSTPECYFRMFCGKKYIYAQYRGTPSSDPKTRRSLPPKYIHVFDYSGKYIKSYYLEAGFNRGFCVDEKNGRIIASSDAGENSLIYFDI